MKNKCVMCGGIAEYYDKNNKELMCSKDARINEMIYRDKERRW